MKKVFYLLFYIFLFILIGIEESFGNTFSFRTYDDRAFCETDRLDGSFVLCTKEQTSGTGLTIAAVYGPQLLETTNERICVEKGKQVEAILCSEQAAALDMTPIGVSTGVSQSTDTISESGIVVDSGTSQSMDSVMGSGIVVDSGTSQLSDSVAVDSGTSQLSDVVVASGSSASVSIEEGFSISGLIEGTMNKIQGMSTTQILFLACIAFAIASIFIGIYYFIKRGRRKNITPNSIPVTNSTASPSQAPSQSSSQYGEALPHRVVNRWVPNPPPPPQNIPSTTSLFAPPQNPPQQTPPQQTPTQAPQTPTQAPQTPPQQTPTQAPQTPQAPQAPTQAPQAPQTPPQAPSTQSSFLANHLGEI